MMIRTIKHQILAFRPKHLCSLPFWVIHFRSAPRQSWRPVLQVAGWTEVLPRHQKIFVFRCDWLAPSPCLGLRLDQKKQIWSYVLDDIRRLYRRRYGPVTWICQLNSRQARLQWMVRELIHHDLPLQLISNRSVRSSDAKIKKT